MPDKKAIVYVDGFNLYYSIKRRGWKQYYWLNLEMLCQKFIPSCEILTKIKYFTSHIKHDPDKVARQDKFLSALDTVSSIEKYFGKYSTRDYKCKQCSHPGKTPTEKQTDVHIAIEMVSDAFRNKYDIAYLITTDSDLVPAVKMVRSEFPEKEVVIVLPPKTKRDNRRRNASDLVNAANDFLHIRQSYLKDSMFPLQITCSYGVLECPEEWRERPQ